MNKISKLVESLSEDEWRKMAGFSSEIEAANKAIFASKSDAEIEQVLREWIKRHQPCLFGRTAAVFDQIQFCILKNEDLFADDKTICDKIQRAHGEWTNATFDGSKSAFVLLAASERIANASPSQGILDIAKILTGFCLAKQDIRADEIYVDNAYLRIPGQKDRTLVFRAGVSYFSVHGDGRWWHDHRMPGGIALSINAVGHFVMAKRVNEGLKKLALELELSDEERKVANMPSLAAAWENAMLTLNNTANAISGRATWLYHADKKPPPSEIKCPIDHPRDAISGMNHCTYGGWFDTDQTLPRLFFQEAVKRPDAAKELELDLTYLFHDDVGNIDHTAIAKGIEIQIKSGDQLQRAVGARSYKTDVREVMIRDCPDLVNALRARERHVPIPPARE